MTGDLQLGPLDLDSIITTNSRASPFEQMVATATNARNWEGNNSCDDCASRDLCPFYANAVTLRNEDARQRLLVLLRHSEMATGQRWNFRDSFSLCAELIVGQHDDFGSGDGVDFPCSWVHERVDEISFGSQPSQKLLAAWETGVAPVFSVLISCMAGSYWRTTSGHYFTIGTDASGRACV